MVFFKSATLIFLLLFPSACFGFAISSFDDLYRLAKSTKNFKNVSKSNFSVFVKTAKVDDIANFAKVLPEQYRVAALLQIASERRLVKPTDVLRLNNEARGIKNYDDVLIGYLRSGERNLSPKIAQDISNFRLHGITRHPKSGVLIDKNGFPIFDSLFDVSLPARMYRAKDVDQFKYATEQLRLAIQRNPSLKKQFTPQQLEQINRGYKPAGFTWHHHQTPGKLQLVNTNLHQQTAHRGGRSIWGGGGEYR